MGFKLDPNTPSATIGNAASLAPVSLEGVTRYYEPTSQATLSLNLPRSQTVATAPTVANTTAVAVNLVDTNGEAGATTLRFLKTGEAEDGSTTWQVYSAGTTGADGKAAGNVTTGDPSTWQTLGTLNFSSDGTLTGGATGSRVAMAVNPGGKFGPVSIDLGAYGKPDESITTLKDLNPGIRQSQNGIAAGTYQSAELTADGYVAATFAGGRQRYLYRIPDATVANPQDLESVTGTVFRPTTESGAIKLNAFGSRSNGTGSGTQTVGASLNSGSVEGSNVTIETQFTTLIQAQRTYSAASKLVSTADEMTQTTLTLKA